MLKAIAGLLIFAASACLAQTATGPSLSGRVLDETGSPLAGVQVRAERVGVFGMAGMLQYFDTDDSGFFLIPNLPYGTYSIGAKKEDDGYPESLYSFYAGKPLA